jgi:hypothetical protein
MHEKINIYYDQIYEIENFLLDKTTNDLLSFVNLEGDKGWIKTHEGHTGTSNNETAQLIGSIGKELENKIINYFNNVEKMVPIGQIKRLKSGESMPGHRDKGVSGYQKKEITTKSKHHSSPTKDICFGIILYLNDDFEGGELYYKDLDLKIKPKKNSMVIHKSNIFHQVLKVKKGTRYSMTSFIIGDESTYCIIK